MIVNNKKDNIVTNEIEILSFNIGNNVYGLRVSNVNEIIKYDKITPLPCTDKRILGIIMPRDTLITVIDLGCCLTQVSTKLKDKDNYYIICNYQDKTVAFLIDTVNDIKRFSEDNIVMPNGLLDKENSKIEGILNTENNLITLLMYDKILQELNL